MFHKKTFIVLKYYLIFMNVVLIIGDSKLIFAPNQTISSNLQSSSHPRNVYVRTLTFSHFISIGFCLFGIVGAIKESFAVTIIYGILMHLASIIILHTISYQQMWLFWLLLFVAVCAYWYAGCIQTMQEEQRTTTSQVGNI